MKTSSGPRLYDSEAVAPIRERTATVLREHLGVNQGPILRPTSLVEDLGADSLDLVELVMMLEEEFDITIPDDQAKSIRTVGDAVDFIIQQRFGG